MADAVDYYDDNGGVDYMQISQVNVGDYNYNDVDGAVLMIDSRDDGELISTGMETAQNAVHEMSIRAGVFVCDMMHWAQRVICVYSICLTPNAVFCCATLLSRLHANNIQLNIEYTKHQMTGQQW